MGKWRTKREDPSPEPEVQKPKVGYEGAKEQIMFHKHITNPYVHFPSRCCKLQGDSKGRKTLGLNLWGETKIVPIFTQQVCVMLDFCYVLTNSIGGWRRQGHDWRLHWNEVVLATHTIIKFEVVPSSKVGQYGSAICNHYAVIFFKRNCYVNQVLIIYKNI